MIASECAKYFAAQNHGTYGDGTETTPVTNATIGVDNIPDADAAVTIGVFTRPGAKPDVKTALSRPGLTIQVRGGKEPAAAFAVAAAILAALHGQHQFYFVTGGTKIYLITAAQSQPVPIQRGKNGRYEYTINLDMIV